MSLYSDFMKETHNRETIEDECGFIMYNFMDSDKIYIAEGYIKPEFRRKGFSNLLADKVVKIGLDNKKKYLVSAVSSLMNNANISHNWHKKYGMRLYKIDRDFIFYIKEI